MRNIKSRISFLLVLVMLAAMLAVPAYAVEVKDGKAIVTDAEIEAAIKESVTDVVSVDFSSVSGLITSVEMSAAALIKVEATGKALSVFNGIAYLEVNHVALSNIAEQVGTTGKITLAMELMPALNPAQEAVKDKMMGWFETDILYGDQQLDVAEGGITVIIPEALVGAMGGNDYDVVKLDENGAFYLVETKSVNGNLVAELTEMAIYAVVEKGVVEKPAAPVNPFVDVAEADWFFNPVMWAVNTGVTGGKTVNSFAPNEFCTRAQVVTFLYAAAGKPEVKVESNPFTDVAESDWFYAPVMWAVANGITGGKTATTFAPNETCTRAQVVTFLYAAAGKPAVAVDNPFVDVAVGDWFANPVLWAVDKGVTGGKTANTFAPNENCTRAQVVTFLYADAGKPAIK